MLPWSLGIHGHAGIPDLLKLDLEERLQAKINAT